MRWKFVGNRRHNVAVKSGPVTFRSRVKRSGFFEKKLTRAGKYRIYCEIHGVTNQSMILKVRP